MEENKNIQTWLSGIIALVVCLAIFWLMPTLTFKPSGLFLPSKTHQTHQSSQITPEQVSFYTNQPASYQTLGIINIERHYSVKSAQIAENEIMRYAQKLAANAGANGVMVKFFGHSAPGAVSSSQAMYKFIGVAIYVNNPGQNSMSSLFYQTSPYEFGGGY